MRNFTFSVMDLDVETQHRIDKYFKRVIINTKFRYLKKDAAQKQKEIAIAQLNDGESIFIGEKDVSADVLCDLFIVDGVKIPIYDYVLSSALRKLKKTQLEIILKYTILKIPIKEIARNLSISTRMVKKHKHNAIITLKKEIQKYEK